MLYYPILLCTRLYYTILYYSVLDSDGGFGDLWAAVSRAAAPGLSCDMHTHTHPSPQGQRNRGNGF